ncbi:hypothetical protein KE423_003917 [Salmonella enterica]|nr:hypothetical protein [Salmonella enterica]
MKIVIKIICSVGILFLIIQALASAADFPQNYFIFCFAVVIARLILTWRWATSPDAFRPKSLVYIGVIYALAQGAIWALLVQEYGDNVRLTPSVIGMAAVLAVSAIALWGLVCTPWRREKRAALTTETP